MLVKYWMKKTVVTVDINDSMQDAISLMKEHFVPLLPVLKRGKLVGVITDSDLKRASASDATTLDVHELAYLISKIRVQEIMTKNPITVPPDFTLEETAARLLMNDISAAPVVDEEEKIVGTISQRELFLALTSLSGFARRGVQFAFMLEDKPGSIKEVTDIIRGYGARLASILTSSERAAEGYRHVYVRAYDVDRDKMDQLLKELREKSELLYMVDHRDNKREEYVQTGRSAEEKQGAGEVSVVSTRRVLFCTDFSENSGLARVRAVEYAKAFQAELLVLHVVSSRLVGYPSFENTIPLDLDELQRTIDERVRTELEVTAAKCKSELGEVKTDVRYGEIPTEIVRYAERNSVDLIVMGTHGWTGIRHVLLGSVAENVLRTASCPVLTVKAPRGSAVVQ